MQRSATIIDILELQEVRTTRSRRTRGPKIKEGGGKVSEEREMDFSDGTNWWETSG